MAIKSIRVSVTGINPILLNNPQTVDPTNIYAKQIKKITAKRIKTEDDLVKLHDIEIRAKIYWEDDQVVIPTTWLTAAIHSISHKRAKIAKKDSRSAIFTIKPMVPLKFTGIKKIKTPEDLVKNHEFRHNMILKQQQARICKSAPIFHDWSFEIELEYDDSIYDADVLEDIIIHAAKYGGFGDFRPTFGRAIALVEHVN